MDTTTLLVALVGVAVVGLVATLAIIRRNRIAETNGPSESPFAVSTEGMKRCPHCGTGNLVTDATCSQCGRRLPG